MTSLDEKKKQRFLFLNKLYEKTNGDRFRKVRNFELGNEIGLSREETLIAIQYLSDEGLMEIRTLGDGGSSVITHEGIIQVEAALSSPDEETEYFPPVNIINIEYMEHSQIQQGTVNSSQTGIFSSEQIESVKALIEEIRVKLPEVNLSEASQKDAEVDIQTIEAQLKSSKPKTSVISECFKSLRNILEGAAGSMIASQLIQGISALPF